VLAGDADGLAQTLCGMLALCVADEHRDELDEVMRNAEIPVPVDEAAE
jgi:hypothetical protein